MDSPVVIDGDNLVKRCVYATAKTDLAAGVWNGGIYNALLMLTRIIDDLEASRIFCAFDQGVPRFRTTLLPDYRKARRDRKEFLTPDQKKEAYKQVGQTRELLELLGVVCVSYQDQEGDDVVAELVRQLREVDRDSVPVVVTNDRDLWQCIEWGAKVYDLQSDTVIGPTELYGATGAHPNEYLLYKTLIGDSSDSVPGAPDVGDKRAAAMIELFRDDLDGLPPREQLDRLIATYEDALKGEDAGKLNAWEATIPENADLLRKAMAVIDLGQSFNSAAYGDDIEAVVHDSWPEVQKMPFLKLAKKHGLGGVLGNPNKFIRPFVSAQRRRD